MKTLNTNMGFYTEFYCKIKLSSNTPMQVIDVLNTHINGHVICELDCTCIANVLPEHAFFKAPRWDSLLCVSYYRHKSNAFKPTNSGSWLLEIHSDFRNYDDEMIKFLDWISPYIQTKKRKLYIGYWRGEDMKQNNIIYYYKFENTITIWPTE